MKKIILIIIAVFCSISIVKAGDYYFELCKSGCEYNDLNDIYQILHDFDRTVINNVTIEVKDNETYTLTHRSTFNWYYLTNQAVIKSVVVFKGQKGNNPTITLADDGQWLTFLDTYYETFENLNFVTDKNISLGENLYNNNGYTKFINCNIKGGFVGLDGHKVYLDNTKITANQLTIDSNEIKNSTIEVDGKPTSMFQERRFSVGDSKIYNSTIKSVPVIDANLYEVKDSNITGEIQAYNLSLDTTTINGKITTNGENIDISNSTITNGLRIVKGYCTYYQPNSQEDNPIYDFGPFAANIKITNSNIKNPNGEAVFVSLRDNYSMVVENSNLSNSTCSVVSNIPITHVCHMGNHNNNIKASFLDNNPKPQANIMVDNSKINCAMTLSTDQRITNAFDMYFTNTNTWTSPPVRGTKGVELTSLAGEGLYYSLPNYEKVLKNNNVVELNGGKIYIEHGNQGTLILDVDLSKDITDYFEDLLPEGVVLGEWLIEDESIVKIVDSKIVPLKIGTTTITGTINNDYYVLYINVKDNPVNPNTRDIILIVAFGLFIIPMIYIVLRLNTKNKYVKE